MAIDNDVGDLAAASHPSTTPGASRRSFLTASTSAAILAGFAARLQAQSAAAAVMPPAQWTPDQELRFLVDRISNGWNSELYQRAALLGYDAFLEEQLAHTSIPDPTVSPMLPQYPSIFLTSKQIYDQYFVVGNINTSMLELRSATLVRAIYSKRQLFERMVEFWSDHFNVDLSDGQVQWLKTAEDRDVIRANALGRFEDLLLADAKSAAMLYYLDNYRNFATAPNENYSREVMELHTLDVNNYTENDVRELARCITGWQYRTTSFTNHGEVFFNASQHDNGTKTVRGVVIPPGGVTEGETVLRSLAHDIATYRFLSTKMCKFFLAYDPPQAVIDAVALAFRVSGGDIKAAVRTMFSRNTLHMMDPAAIVKIKRPFHLVASVVRGLNPTVAAPFRLVNELTTMGHLTFAWTAPNGYPDTALAWGTTLLDRWNFMSRFFSESISGVGVNVEKLFGPVSKNLLASHANRLLLGGRMSPEDVNAVQAYANATTTLNDTLRRDVLALTASTPSFQTY
jgi:uncharacterized protein (DUF1800 family)